MTVQLNWPADLVEKLTDEARKKGLSLDTYLLEAVLQKASNGSPDGDEQAQRAKREQAAASIRELRKGNVLGPELATRDLIEEGRRF
jgi:hypothetical protein